jgi:hypothetical protein
MQSALSTYLGALGTMAADGVLPFREDPFADLVPVAAAADEEGGRAVAALGAQLRHANLTNARAPQLRGAIVEADPSLQALVAALSRQVAAAASATEAARAAEAASHAQLEQGARDAVTRQAIRDIAALRARDASIAAAARTGYGVVLSRIAEGHALMAARARHLSQEETARQVRAAEDRLRRAEAQLPRGLVPPEGWLACPGPAEVVPIPSATGAR